MKFCEVQQNSESWRFWKFQLSILTNKKVLFLNAMKLCNSCNMKLDTSNHLFVVNPSVWNRPTWLHKSWRYVHKLIYIISDIICKKRRKNKKCLPLAGPCIIPILFVWLIKFMLFKRSQNLISHYLLVILWGQCQYSLMTFYHFQTQYSTSFS